MDIKETPVTLGRNNLQVVREVGGQTSSLFFHLGPLLGRVLKAGVFLSVNCWSC